MSVEAALAHLAGDRGVDIHYGRGTLRVERAAMETARRIVGEVPADTLAEFTELVSGSLRTLQPRGMRNRASRREMDEFYRNMMLWAALREVTS
jgi:hypothetical protein